MTGHPPTGAGAPGPEMSRLLCTVTRLPRDYVLLCFTQASTDAEKVGDSHFFRGS